MAKELTPIDELKRSITLMEPQFKTALPAHIPVKKFTRVLLTAVSTNSGLANATKTSLFGSCMKLAQMGLLPDGKEAAIVTFKTKTGDEVAKEMPMSQGLLKLVRNSGELSSLTMNIVCKNDEFDYYVDSDGEHLKHQPNMFGDRGEVIGAYALAKTKDGAVYIEVMSVDEIEKVRRSSRAAESGPWSGWWPEMAKKTVFRRLYKRLPSSTDIDTLIEAEDEIFDEPVAKPIPQQKEESRDVTETSQRLASAMAASRQVPNHAPGAEPSELPV